MNRRDLLKGMAGILASGIAPSVITTAGVLMPMHRIMLPDEFSPNEARRLLGSCAMRFVRTGYPPNPPNWYPKLEVQVSIAGRWMHLARTDLWDNVCTTDTTDWLRNLERTRDNYLSRIQNSSVEGWIGARVNEYRHGATFAVVDSVSDG